MSADTVGSSWLYKCLKCQQLPGALPPGPPPGAHKQAPGPHARLTKCANAFSTKLSLFLTIISIKITDFHALCGHFWQFLLQKIFIFFARFAHTKK